MRPAAPLLVLAAAALAGADAAAQDERSIFSVLDTQGRSIRVESVAAGSLSAADLLSAGGRRVQVWSLAASAGDEIQVDLRSDDFDAFLYVVGPGLGEGLRDDDGGEGLDSRLCMSIRQPGEYRVVASSLSGGMGDFTLQVSARPGAVDGVCPEEASADYSDPAELPTDGRTLTLGEEAVGFLGQGDPTFFGVPAQAWEVTGRAGAHFSVDLISDDFDALLMVQGPGLAEWLEDDDGAGACNARMSWDFPADGSYRVVVSSLTGGTGGFRLVADADPPPPDPARCADVGGFPEEDTDEIVGVSVGDELALDVTYDGAMTGEEGTVSGRSMQAWTLTGLAGVRYVVDMQSDDFDTYLYFGGPGFPDLVEDDDGGDGLDSRICVELPSSGEYRVYGGPLSGSEPGGRFTIRASQREAEGLCATFQLSPAAMVDALADLPTEGRRIGPGEEVDGFLDPAGPTVHPEDGRTIQPWSLEAPAGAEVFVDAVSGDFDPVLYVVGPGFDQPLFVDDFGDGCNARASFVVAGPGTVLLPGAYFSGTGGAYRLRVTRDPPPIESGGCVSPDAEVDTGGGAAADPGALAGVSAGSDRRLAVGTEVAGTLGFGDDTLPGGEPAQAWVVDVRAGDELVFELLSDDFDPVLYLDAGGALGPIMDDDGAGGLDSRIVFTPALDGSIRLVVTALSSDGSGSFRLRVIRRVR